MPDQRNLDLFICYEIQGARSLDDLDEFIAFGMTFSILNFPSSTGRSIMLNVASSIDREFRFYLSLSSLRIRPSGQTLTKDSHRFVDVRIYGDEKRY